jgi:hypothetical protein
MISSPPTKPPTNGPGPNWQERSRWLPQKRLSNFFGVGSRSIWARKRREDARPPQAVARATPAGHKKLSNFFGVPTQAISAWRKQRRDDRNLEIGFLNKQVRQGPERVQAPFRHQNEPTSPRIQSPNPASNLALKPTAKRLVYPQNAQEQHPNPTQYDWHHGERASWAVRRPESRGPGSRQSNRPNSKRQSEGLPLGIFGSANPRHDLSTTINESIVSSTTDLQVTSKTTAPEAERKSEV